MVAVLTDEEAVRSICERLRDSDRHEVDALLRSGSGWLWSVAPEAYRFARFRRVFRNRNRPVAFFTAHEETSSTLRVAMLATDDWPTVAQQACFWWLKVFKLEALAAGYARAECRVHEPNVVAVDLLTRLGFGIEGRVPHYSWCGEPFLQMAWIDDVSVQSSQDSSPTAAPDAGGRSRGG